ncbi:GNAT family N-acetyltransferase [Lentilactobacillus sp. Marseille-Q4993]|uniref:GNAT family N-acetyltransferase n=1 Tax=Lentilactobacillus sp. Marseille-Q4993 TaxID=3039492 RepID=UPI0024BD40FB|nr:GNAT family N-acetyltransferase [Lentilactobacillus sp. Marseille-Q4993]
MNINFSHPKPDQINQIMIIENSGFTPDEAASFDSMLERIKVINDTFITAVEDGKLAGYIVGPASNKRYIDDELYEKSVANDPNDDYQTVLSLVVHPDFKHHGIASALLTELKRVASDQGRKAITLTCLERLVSFYEDNGYQNEGVSDSSHAGETWYNMVLTL